MEFIDIPTEQTTAITDIFLALAAMFVSVSIFRIGKRVDRTKTHIWSWAFSLLAAAAMIGAIAHGIKMSTQLNYIIWQPLNLFLGLAIALFAAGVIYDSKGYSIPKSIFILLIISALLFYSITLFIPGSFFIFILYEALAMLFSLVMYSYLWIKKRFLGAKYMAIGILITIIAAVIQSSNISLTLIWVFDHNGLFHIVQIIALYFLFIGLKTEFRSRDYQI